MTSNAAIHCREHAFAALTLAADYAALARAFADVAARHTPPSQPEARAMIQAQADVLADEVATLAALAGQHFGPTAAKKPVNLDNHQCGVKYCIGATGEGSAYCPSHTASHGKN